MNYRLSRFHASQEDKYRDEIYFYLLSSNLFCLMLHCKIGFVGALSCSQVRSRRTAIQRSLVGFVPHDWFAARYYAGAVDI